MPLSAFIRLMTRLVQNMIVVNGRLLVDRHNAAFQMKTREIQKVVDLLTLCLYILISYFLINFRFCFSFFLAVFKESGRSLTSVVFLTSQKLGNHLNEFLVYSRVLLKYVPTYDMCCFKLEINSVTFSLGHTVYNNVFPSITRLFPVRISNAWHFSVTLGRFQLGISTIFMTIANTTKCRIKRFG